MDNNFQTNNLTKLDSFNQILINEFGIDLFNLDENSDNELEREIAKEIHKHFIVKMPLEKLLKHTLNGTKINIVDKVLRSVPPTLDNLINNPKTSEKENRELVLSLEDFGYDEVLPTYTSVINGREIEIAQYNAIVKKYHHPNHESCIATLEKTLGVFLKNETSHTEKRYEICKREKESGPNPSWITPYGRHNALAVLYHDLYDDLEEEYEEYTFERLVGVEAIRTIEDHTVCKKIDSTNCDGYSSNDFQKKISSEKITCDFMNNEILSSYCRFTPEFLKYLQTSRQEIIRDKAEKILLDTFCVIAEYYYKQEQEYYEKIYSANQKLIWFLNNLGEECEKLGLKLNDSKRTDYEENREILFNKLLGYLNYSDEEREIYKRYLESTRNEIISSQDIEKLRNELMTKYDEQISPDFPSMLNCEIANALEEFLAIIYDILREKKEAKSFTLKEMDEASFSNRTQGLSDTFVAIKSRISDFEKIESDISNEELFKLWMERESKSLALDEIEDYNFLKKVYYTKDYPERDFILFMYRVFHDIGNKTLYGNDAYFYFCDGEYSLIPLCELPYIWFHQAMKMYLDTYRDIETIIAADYSNLYECELTILESLEQFSTLYKQYCDAINSYLEEYGYDKLMENIDFELLDTLEEMSGSSYNKYETMKQIYHWHNTYGLSNIKQQEKPKTYTRNGRKVNRIR